MNKAPPIPAPPMGKAPPPAKYSIPRRRSSSQPRPVPAVVVTPPQPNKQQKGKSTKAPKAATKGTTKTKQSGETDGDKAMRLQMEAYLKRPKGSDESSSSRSSGRTTRGSTKRVHSPGEPSKTKKKDEKPSPASAAATTTK